MKNHAGLSKCKKREISESEKKKNMASIVKIIHEALGQEFYPGTLIKKCPNRSITLKKKSSCNMCDDGEFCTLHKKI
jgi:hypothetical protein